MDSIKWQRWDEGTFDVAREEGKPLFVWVEYFGCRACAKMEEESFGDPDIAKILNGSFVPIRISRESRPDLDRHFQRIFTTMTGKDEGWPLSVFVDADKTPLYAASYLPSEARDGLMGLGEIASLVSKKYHDDKEMLLSKGREVLSQLDPPKSIKATKIEQKALKQIFSDQLKGLYDTTYGGFGTETKHLYATTLHAALDCCLADNDSGLSDMVAYTLDNMLKSSIWDERYGGFYCCSMDRSWETPLRRKSLAQNALMARVLIKAASIKEESRYLEAASRIVEWALKDMRDGSSGFFHAAIEGDSIDRRVFTCANAMMVAAMLKLSKSNTYFHPEAMGLIGKLMESVAAGHDVHHQLEGDGSNLYLEDYAAMAEAMIAASDLSGNENFMISASEVAGSAIRKFYNNGFWNISNGDLADPVSFLDTNIPSPAAKIAMVLGRLGVEMDKAYTPFAHQTFVIASYDLMRQPISMSSMTEAALLYGVKKA